MMRYSLAGFCTRIMLALIMLLATTAVAETARAAEPPTSDWGTMPNGWDGYSLRQPGGLKDTSPGRDGSGNGHPPGHGHGHGHGHHHHHHHGHYHWYPRWHYPYFYPYYQFTYPRGISLGVGVQPSRIIPGAGLAPGAHVAARRQRLQAAADEGQAKRDLAEIRRRVASLRESTPRELERGNRIIAQADEMFAEQQYARAAARYRQALVQAPDHAEAMFRLGHAYVALQDYDLALTYFLMALEIQGAPQRPGFSLSDLYDGDAAALQAHLDALTDAALRNPEQGGLLMLIGLTLYYGHQHDRAEQFFERAAELPGVQSEYAERLAGPAAAEPVEAKVIGFGG